MDVDADTVLTALEQLTSAHKRLNGKLCDHLTYDTPIADDDLRGLVRMADDVTKAIRGVVGTIATKEVSKSGK